MGKTIWGGGWLFAAWLAVACPAVAYPTSVVYAPTGKTVGFGQGNLSFYEAFYGGAASVWAGFNVGVVPAMRYGASGLSFGGIELGLDVIAQRGLNPDVKPIGNIKFGLLEEVGWVPDLSVGLMSYAYLHPDRSLNYGYGVASKNLALGQTPIGRLTLGLGNVFTSNKDLFTPTPPFPTGTLSLLAGYEFPAIGPFTFAADHVGGDSEVSSTSMVFNLEVVPGTFASVGYTFGHDRAASPADSYFIQTYTNFDLVKVFVPVEEVP